MSGDRFCFLVDWLDPHAQVVWKYQLIYYTVDESLEMYDIKNRRVFLKRCQYPSVKLENLYVGSIVTVYSRQLTVSEYADEYTKEVLEKTREKTLGIVYPEGMKNFGKIIHAVYRSGFVVNKLKMVSLSPGQAKAFPSPVTSDLSKGKAVAMELVADSAHAKWAALCGDGPNSLNSHFGNCCYASASDSTADQDLGFFFGQPHNKCYEGKGSSTLCLIKPHAVLAGYAGMMIDQIQANYTITACEMFMMDRPNSMEFYEVYKGVVAEFSSMVEELTSGQLIAIEVSDPDGECPVEPFRQMCGPPDPEIARVLRSESLRAKFGVDKVKNAVHCTDLEEDGQLEVTYFFDLLQQ